MGAGLKGHRYLCVMGWKEFVFVTDYQEYVFQFDWDYTDGAYRVFSIFPDSDATLSRGCFCWTFVWGEISYWQISKSISQSLNDCFSFWSIRFEDQNININHFNISGNLRCDRKQPHGNRAESRKHIHLKWKPRCWPTRIYFILPATGLSYYIHSNCITYIFVHQLNAFMCPVPPAPAIEPFHFS